MSISSSPRLGKRGERQRGFTLLEVMVALAVIAFSLAAAVGAVTSNTRNASGLQQRSYAHWVAMNKMAELHVTDKWPSTRTSKGSTLMARHEWFWEMKVSKTEIESMRRVEIAVKADEDDENALVTLTGFVGRP